MRGAEWHAHLQRRPLDGAAGIPEQSSRLQHKNELYQSVVSSEGVDGPGLLVPGLFYLHSAFSSLSALAKFAGRKATDIVTALPCAGALGQQWKSICPL